MRALGHALRSSRLPGIDSLGDTIQSLASRRFLPSVDVVLEREQLHRGNPDCGGEATKATFNGWFMHQPQNWPPHASIVPLLISMHFSGAGYRRRPWAKNAVDVLVRGEGREYLRRFGPVGARDLATLGELERRKVSSYLSGCLTLTLTLPGPTPRRADELVATDLPESALAELARFGRPIHVTTHSGGATLDAVERERAAMALLQRYRAASAVVTTRIHAALPCLALGTPVLLLYDRNSPRRVTDTRSLLHSARVDDFVVGRTDFDVLSPPPNPEAFRPLARDLVARCRAFTGHDGSTDSCIS